LCKARTGTSTGQPSVAESLVTVVRAVERSSKLPGRGTLTTPHSFDDTDGANPYAGLVQATDGDFYGTTTYGGDRTCNVPLGCGTVFKITPAGTLSTLRFDLPANPLRRTASIHQRKILWTTYLRGPTMMA